MYVIPIHVPIYLDGTRSLIGTEWKRSLELLRDSLDHRYGPLVVLAPSLPADLAMQALEPVTLQHDAIDLRPSFDERTRLRGYWFGAARNHWMSQAAELLERASVVHATAGDAFRPYCVSALFDALRARLPTVFVLDQDIVARLRRVGPALPWPRRLETLLHAQLYESQCRRAVAGAGLVLLKGRSTVARFSAVRKDVRAIEDTSYLSREIVPAQHVDARLRSLLSTSRPLRLAFCGRLAEEKGVDVSINIVACAIRIGARLVFDIIGGGPAEASLRRQVLHLGLADSVHFHGQMAYGPELLKQLAGSDLLLFTPRIEETPRMIFDGYAAGLPMVARAIDYAVERAEADRAAVLLPDDLRDVYSAAAVLQRLDADRYSLEELTRNAQLAACTHAADQWYRRRAEWTHDMVARQRAERSARA